MSTTLISVDQYLHGVWEPDCEYVNGEVLERSMGEKDHGNWQGALVRLLSAWRQSAHIQVIPELRMRTVPDRYRIPDVTVLDRNAPDERAQREECDPGQKDPTPTEQVAGAGPEEQ